jgi:nucleotide-binding universal stress UspA family protein
MPFKDILVHLDASAPSAHRHDYAVQLAVRDEAHLIGLYTLDLVPALSELARAYPGRIEQYETYINMRKAELDRAKRVETQFRDALAREGIEGEWRFVEASPAETVALHARYVDIAIVGQIDPAHLPMGTGPRVPQEALLASGRPLIIVPYAGAFDTVAEHVVVGWKATPEAARAMAAALPILERAKKVIVVTVNPERGSDPEPGIPAADITLHLARHGVRAEAATTIAEEIDTGDALLNYVADTSADFLVMGGYGHTRAREAMFGGVTRKILEQMTVPVLMAH